MKKNILAIIILAATLINLTISAMLMFTFIPYVKRSNNLIKNILGVIDIELESPSASDYAPKYKLEDINFVSLLTEATANLKTGTDGKPHYAQVTASIMVNTGDEDYNKETDALVEKHKSELAKFVYAELAKYTADNIIENQAVIEQAVLESIQTYFSSRFVVGVTITLIVT